MAGVLDRNVTHSGTRVIAPRVDNWGAVLDPVQNVLGGMQKRDDLLKQQAIENAMYSDKMAQQKAYQNAQMVNRDELLSMKQDQMTYNQAEDAKKGYTGEVMMRLAAEPNIQKRRDLFADIQKTEGGLAPTAQDAKTFLDMTTPAQPKGQTYANYINKEGVTKSLPMGSEVPQGFVPASQYKNVFDKKGGSGGSTKDISKALAGISANNYVYGDREDAMNAIDIFRTKASTAGLDVYKTDKAITEALTAATDEDGDFNVEQFDSYLATVYGQKSDKVLKSDRPKNAETSVKPVAEPKSRIELLYDKANSAERSLLEEQYPELKQPGTQENLRQNILNFLTK